MVAHRLAENLERLIDQGHAPSKPAAYVVAATTPEQHVITGTLADLASRIPDERRSHPALVIVGDVVALRERIRWFEQKPLSGRHVLIARARPGRSKIAAQLRTFGAQVTESPKVSVEDLDGYMGLDQALAARDRFDAIVFGCAAGVEAVARRDLSRHLRSDRSGAFGVIAVGEEASAAMKRSGIAPTLRLDGACHDAVTRRTPDLTAKRLLLIVASQGRTNLQTEFEALGARVEVVPAYRYVYAFERYPEALPDLLLLPSSSAACLVLTGREGSSLTSVPMLAIGPTAEAAARRLGATDVTQAPTDSIDALVAGTLAFFADRSICEQPPVGNRSYQPNQHQDAGDDQTPQART